MDPVGALVTRLVNISIMIHNYRHLLQDRWGAWAAAFIVVFLLAGCAQLPTLEGRSHSTALTETDDTQLGRAIAPLLKKHPGESGIIALADGYKAFAARSILAQA